MSGTVPFVDAVAEHLASAVDPGELPLFGKVWTLQIEDDDLVLRMQRKVNGTRVPRHAPDDPPPQQQPQQDPPKKDDDKKGGDQ